MLKKKNFGNECTKIRCNRYHNRQIAKKISEKSKIKKMLNVFKNMLAAENHKKNFEFLMKKKYLQANALKVGATSNIIDELRKIFQKNKGLKKL